MVENEKCGISGAKEYSLIITLAKSTSLIFIVIAIDIETSEFPGIVTVSVSATLVSLNPYFNLNSLPRSSPTKDVVLEKDSPDCKLVVS